MLQMASASILKSMLAEMGIPNAKGSKAKLIEQILKAKSEGEAPKAMEFNEPVISEIEDADQAKKAAVKAKKKAEEASPNYDYNKKLEEAKKKAKKKSKKVTATPTEYKEIKSVVKYNKLYTEWEDVITLSEYEAVETYTGADYKKINGSLRGKFEMTKEMKETTEKISRALRKWEQEESVSVWRGTNASTFKDINGVDVEQLKSLIKQGKNADKEALLDALQGKKFTEKGFTSTAILKSQAWDNKDFLMEVHIPEGSNYGAYVDGLSKHEGEKEFLLDKGLTYKINDVKWDEKKKMWNVVCDIIKREE